MPPKASSRASFDGDELQELRSLRQEMNETCRDNEDLRLEVGQIREEISVMNQKQTDIVIAVTEMNSAVGNIGTQLATMSSAINSLKKVSTDSAPLPTKQTTDIQKSPTFQQYQHQQHEQLTEALRQRLLVEQEKTQYIDLLTCPKLPAINTARRSAPPGFANIDRIHTNKKVSTPAFHTFNQNKTKVDQMWKGYARDYEKEMRTQFFKSITKGPRMDFPRFDGDNPVGWIRQCEKYFQMAAAPEEYKVHLAQLYFIGPADVWLRRSGLHKQQLS
uniref:Uncharacterized protein n=1 Tax=Avena sativa TaxID=4498 RepID=A0ACD5Y3G3_AVESA